MINGTLLEKEQIEVNKYLDDINQITQQFPDEKEQADDLKNYSTLEIYYLISKLIQTASSDKVMQAVFVFLQNDPVANRLQEKAILLKDSFEPLLLDVASQSNNYFAIKQLLHLRNAKEQISNISPNVILNLIQSDKNDLVLQFFQLGANPNQRDSLGITPAALMLARKKSDLFKAYFELNESIIDLNVLCGQQRSLLHYAAISGDPEMVSFLLTKGLSIHQKDLYGFTALDYALFSGNLAVAEKISLQSQERLQTDPRYNNPPPRIDHGKLVENIMTYIKTTHIECQDPDVQMRVPKIEGGVCNGWSMLAALSAAQSDEELDKFYKMCDLFCQWDGNAESLKTIPDEFKEEFGSLDKIFFHLTNEIYWFFQQNDVFSGVSRHDRVKQLQLISDKYKIENLTDFGLPDLSEEELKVMLEAYQPIANDVIIDVRTNDHDTAFYQKASDHIAYFDPNMRVKLPLYQDYAYSLAQTKDFRGRINGLAYFNCHPEKLTPQVHEHAAKITEELIQRFIVENLERKNGLRAILVHAARQGLPMMLKALLNYPEIKESITDEMLDRTFSIAYGRNTFECLHVLYQHGVDCEQLEAHRLEALLHTAIQYDDREMFKVVNSALDKVLQKQQQSPSFDQRNLMLFNYPEERSTQEQPPTGKIKKEKTLEKKDKYKK